MFCCPVVRKLNQTEIFVLVIEQWVCVCVHVEACWRSNHIWPITFPCDDKHQAAERWCHFPSFYVYQKIHNFKSFCRRLPKTAEWCCCGVKAGALHLSLFITKTDEKHTLCLRLDGCAQLGWLSCLHLNKHTVCMWLSSCKGGAAVTSQRAFSPETMSGSVDSVGLSRHTHQTKSVPLCVEPWPTSLTGE